MKLPLVSHYENKLKQGFTLIEVLLVLALSVVILAMSAPLALQFYRQQLVLDASGQLQDTLNIARAYAVSNVGDAPHGVRIFPASSTYVLFQGGTYATRLVSEDQIYTLSPSVSVTATSTEVVFSQLYGTSTLDAVWSLSAGTVSKDVHIYISGNIELTSNTVPASQYA